MWSCSTRQQLCTRGAAWTTQHITCIRHLRVRYSCTCMGVCTCTRTPLQYVTYMERQHEAAAVHAWGCVDNTAHHALRHMRVCYSCTCTGTSTGTCTCMPSTTWVQGVEHMATRGRRQPDGYRHVCKERARPCKARRRSACTGGGGQQLGGCCHMRKERARSCRARRRDARALEEEGGG
jgi:hypothetical protein